MDSANTSNSTDQSVEEETRRRSLDLVMPTEQTILINNQPNLNLRCEKIHKSTLKCNDQVKSIIKQENSVKDILKEVKIEPDHRIEEGGDIEIEEGKICLFPSSHLEKSPEFISPQDLSSEKVTDVKRKRSLSSEKEEEQSEDDAKSKRAKQTSDHYCWRCHRESVEAFCSACPRSWHRKCMGGLPPIDESVNWICVECASTLKAENASTRTPIMANLTVQQLCMVLRYIIERLRMSPGSEPFWKAVDSKEVPNYLDFIIKPMDLNLLESNVRNKLYGSTDAFMADAKWILHNCIVFNTCGGTYPDTTKLTNSAKQLIKIARQEVSELEACTDCYIRGRNLPRPQSAWFIEVCRPPHPVIWAKLKGFPFWPAKAMPRTNSQGFVDVRFFGEHDRAWVSPKDVYLYSKEPPTALPRKRKCEMIDCFTEIEEHCRKLEESFGRFEFAPLKTPYNPYDPMQIKILLPEYNPVVPIDESITGNQQNITMGNGFFSPPKNTISTPKKKIEPVIQYNVESESEISINNSPEKVEDPLAPTLDIAEGVKQKKRGKKLILKSMEPPDIPMNIDMHNLKAAINLKKNSTPRRIIKKIASSGKSPTETLDNSVEVIPMKTISKKRQSISKKGNNSVSSNGKVLRTVNSRISKPKSKSVDKMEVEIHDSSQQKKISSCNNTSLSSIYSESPSEDCASTSASSLGNQSGAGHNKTIENIDQESKESPMYFQIPSLVRKPGRAKKSFPNKPKQINIRNQTSAKPELGPMKPMVYIPTHRIVDLSSYELPPPEAGPLSTRLNKNANELIKHMALLIEETIKEAGESKMNNMGNSVDNHQATVYSLRLQIERMRWLHDQQITELKYNTERTLREMRSSFDAERVRAIEENNRIHEEEIMKRVEETKTKQWCTSCGNEAIYYCCWNTTYCSETCQKVHWRSHRSLCTQKVLINPVEGVPGNSRQGEQLQEMPNLVISAQNTSIHVRGA